MSTSPGPKRARERRSRGLFRRLVTRSPSCRSKLSGFANRSASLVSDTRSSYGTVLTGRKGVRHLVAARFEIAPRGECQTPSGSSRGRRRPAGSRRGGAAARPASGRPSTRRARSPRALPAPLRAAPAREHRRSSAAFTASSTSAIARSCSTWKNPGPVANSSTSFPPGWIRVEPAFSVAISGAWRASTPISPAAPGTMIISASPSNAAPSGVTSETENGLRSAMPRRWRRTSVAPSRPRPRSGRPCRRPARGARRAGRRGSPGSRGSCPRASRTGPACR